MKYSFKTSQDINLIYGTSLILNIADDYSGEEFAKIQGQLITLFGEPLETSPDLENAYNYVIIATDARGKQTVLPTYCGPSGPAIGGDVSIQGIREIAGELKSYIKQATPLDYEYVGYYLDAPAKIIQKVENGVAFYVETMLSENEYDEAAKICYGQGE